MSLFDSVSKKLSEAAITAAKTAAKKSSDFIEVAKLNMNVEYEEGKAEKALLEIGKVVYERFTNNYKKIIFDEQLQNLCEDV